MTVLLLVLGVNPISKGIPPLTGRPSTVEPHGRRLAPQGRAARGRRFLATTCETYTRARWSSETDVA